MSREDKTDTFSRRIFIGGVAGTVSLAAMSGCLDSENSGDSTQGTNSENEDDQSDEDNTPVDFVTQILNGEGQLLESIALGPERQTSQAYAVAIDSEQEIGEEPRSVSVYIADPDSSQTWDSPLPNQLGENTVTYSTLAEFLPVGEQHNLTAEVQFDNQTETATVPITLLQAISPEIAVESQPEMAKPLILNASSEAENAKYAWDIAGDQMQGSSIEIIPEDVGDLDVSLQASKGDRTQTVENTLDVELWDNTDMRLRQMETHPKERLSSYNGYGFSIVDEEAIRNLIEGDILQGRKDSYNGGMAITALTDYENIKSRSMDQFISNSFEFYDLNEVIDNANDKMEQVSPEIEVNEDLIKYQGSIRPKDPEVFGIEEGVRHEVYVLPESEFVLMHRREGYVPEEDDFYGDQDMTNRIQERVLATAGEIENIKEDVKFYTEEDLFNKKGVLIDRIQNRPQISGWTPDIVEEYGDQIRSVDKDPGPNYTGFRVNPLIYDSELDKPAHHIKAPYAPLNILPRGQELAEISIDKKVEDEMDVLGQSYIQ